VDRSTGIVPCPATTGGTAAHRRAADAHVPGSGSSAPAAESAQGGSADGEEDHVKAGVTASPLTFANAKVTGDPAPQVGHEYSSGLGGRTAGRAAPGVARPARPATGAAA